MQAKQGVKPFSNTPDFEDHSEEMCCLHQHACGVNLLGLGFHFIQHLTVWGVEPVVTHQTSWLESTVAN